jgi:hypothetical protein
MSKELVRSDGPDSGKGQFLVYEAEDGRIKIDVRFENENVWLTQKLMADLIQTTKQNISLHIQSVFEEGELAQEATVKKYLTVRREGKRDVKRLLALNDLVEQYLIFAEGQAMRRLPMHMTDWIKKLDAFLSVNEREILPECPGSPTEVPRVRYHLCQWQQQPAESEAGR